MVYSALSDDSSTVSQFTRRKKITITTGGTSTPANYQVKLTITYESEMQVDFDDIRFNTRDGDYIDYWIESYTASTTATVWVELPDAITDPGSDIIYMYYGNASLSSGINGPDTFLACFDGDSTGWTEVDPNGHIAFTNNRLEFTALNRDESAYVYQSNANIDNDIIIESNLELTAHATTGFVAFGAICTSAGSWDAITDAILPHRFYYGPNVVAIERVSSSDDVSNVVAYAENTEYWTRSTVIRSGNITTELFTDSARTSQSGDDIVVDISAAVSMSYIHLIQSWDDNNADRTMTGWVDNFIVRKYIANEPTPSYGKAQHQRRVPQFIG